MFALFCTVMWLTVASLGLSLNVSYIIADEFKARITVMVPLDSNAKRVIVEWDGDGPRASAGSTSRQIDKYTTSARQPFVILFTPGVYYIRGKVLYGDGSFKVTEVRTLTVIPVSPSAYN
jgi:hypothetical protein